ncbi:interleukin-6 receptor subunit alpha isoform X1 [Sardina pilchardus]|uniref:interleukin-6 receptor subunit alpha isoform X1 n=1 Tax=Sardina pilchardus TaxID=27697 RepID=UPI002E12A775
MRIWTKFASLWSILVVAEVQCTQCNVTWTEPLHDLHDALVVIPGSEVVIGCCGDVSLDGVLMVRGTCPGVQGSDSGQITTENILLSTNHGSDTVDSLETNQLEGGTDYKAGSDSSEMDNGSQWMLNGQPVQGNAGMGWNLMLPSFGLADAGNYSCHRAGRWMSTVRMDLANSPERPTLTCRRKDLYKRKIRCDWKASRPINPAPKCHLILHKLMSQEQRVSSCRYSPKRSRCRCLLEPEALDTDSIWYAARLSVRSTSGCGTSRWIDFTPQSILKPDPPVSVNVRSVDGQERTLDVFWSYPTSWRTRRGTYLLKFELRYYPVLGKMNQTVAIPRTSPRLSWRISDALAGVQYAVQIRSMEEHGQGSWSDWSSAVYAHTWIAPKPTESSDISEDPLILLVIPGTTPGSVVLYLLCCVNVTQSAAQKKVQCLCSPQDDFRQYYISPPTADVVHEAKDHCTTAWTCNSTECAYYDYEVPEKEDAMMFAAPVVNASFEAVVMENHVVVLVTVDCPQKGFIAKDLPCPCERQTSSSPPSIPTKQNRSEISHTPPPDKTDVPLKIVLPLVVFVIVTVFGSVAVVFIIKRYKDKEKKKTQPPTTPKIDPESLSLSEHKE